MATTENKRGESGEDEGTEYQRTWGATREYKAEMADRLTPKEDTDEPELAESVRAEQIGVNPSTGYPHPGSSDEGATGATGASGAAA